MKLLLFSDLHRDLAAAHAVVERSDGVDVVIGAGDFATRREGLDEVIDVLSVIRRPTVLVCGNGESPEELRVACENWDEAHVLHGDGVDIDAVSFFGLGAAVPITPFGNWSYDLPEPEAESELAACPEAAVLVVHSPPHGHADLDSQGVHRGSRAILATVRATAPRLVVCGHIHDSWGEVSYAGDTPVVNAGPRGRIWDL